MKRKYNLKLFKIPVNGYKDMGKSQRLDTF